MGEADRQKKLQHEFEGLKLQYQPPESLINQTGTVLWYHITEKIYNSSNFQEINEYLGDKQQVLFGGFF